ncbi:hypothetical protein BJ741DRAFT_670034 [Chytriomyces cf. hyalinus JEL632]|nr:hypothetical protein BJ741DRAFT_670034 [Chytriomyces cf. hyalinus JEL632]
MSGYQAYTLSILVSIVSAIPENSSNSLYLVEAVQQKDLSWDLVQTVRGPRTGIVFSMTADGQVYYSSQDTDGWLSTKFQYLPVYGSLNNALFNTVNVSDYLAISGSVSGTATIAAPTVITSNYTLTLPTNAAPTDGNYALVQQTNAGLGWQKLPNANPTFFAGTDNVSSPADITGLKLNTDHMAIYVFVQVTAAVSFNTLALSDRHTD